MSDTLAYFKRAAQYSLCNEVDFLDKMNIALVTNFTDDVLHKFLIALSLENNIYPRFFVEPYKRYLFDLTNRQSELWTCNADITYFFFDVHAYGASDLAANEEYLAQLVAQIEEYTKASRGHVVVCTFPLPLVGAYGNLEEENTLYNRVIAANTQIRELAQRFESVSVFDVNRIIGLQGDLNIRDLRSLYAFDVPFRNEFFLAVAREMVSYLLAMRGRNRKCLVVDLDNTLWGGVVGEVGVHNIALGPGYPGLAYQSFQRAIRSFYDRGIILAIASRNNPEDIEEVFLKNKNMILEKKHFASIQVTWLPKSELLKAIAVELNIGLDSLVFIDDDAANREEVRLALPSVMVPELSSRPEEYIKTLFSLTCFNQLKLTDEDRVRGHMYATERKRTEILASVHDSHEYLGRLGINIVLHENDINAIPRLAQLSQKTNQFNLTTRRYSEEELVRIMHDGGKLYSAEVFDNFGTYGIVFFAILLFNKNGDAYIDTLLMSCRAMARGVEYAVTDAILEHVNLMGYTRVTASFLPTQKNAPARDFLPSFGFLKELHDETAFTLSVSEYCRQKPQSVEKVLPYITIIKHLNV